MGSKGRDMPEISGLTVRQHARKDFDLAIEFIIGEQHQEQVRFSPMSTAKDQHALRGRAIDISTGGMGWVCDHFVPRMCVGTVRVFDPRPVGAKPDGTPIHDVAFEHHCVIRRVTMVSHDPSYSIGVAFVEPDPNIGGRVEKLRELSDAQLESAAARVDDREEAGRVQ
jgi:c-di-GMP-binding flagellar brake protein YcgR